MTIREVSERYNIPMEILKEYETWARKRAAQKTVGAWQYDDADLERLSLVLSLHEMGFDSREVELYLKLLGQEGTEAQRIRMLSQKKVPPAGANSHTGKTAGAAGFPSVSRAQTAKGEPKGIAKPLHINFKEAAR